MKRRPSTATIIALVALFFSLPGVAVANGGHSQRVERIALVDYGVHRITRTELVRAASALTIQANRDLRRWWHGPRIDVHVFPASYGSPWGWPNIAIYPGSEGWVAGLHYPNDAKGSGMGAWVFAGSGVPWTVTASHELLEMLEDPSGRMRSHGRLREICDPVQARTYRINGIAVSDFVTPAWFTRSTRRWWDGQGLLRHR